MPEDDNMMRFEVEIHARGQSKGDFDKAVTQAYDRLRKVKGVKKVKLMTAVGQESHRV